MDKFNKDFNKKHPGVIKEKKQRQFQGSPLSWSGQLSFSEIFFSIMKVVLIGCSALLFSLLLIAIVSAGIKHESNKPIPKISTQAASSN
jgi:hypothetical protein